MPERARSPSHVRSASVRRNNSTDTGDVGQHRAPLPSARRSAWPAPSPADGRPRTEPSGRVRSLAGHPRIEDQQRRTVAAAAPPGGCRAASGRCSAAPPSARRPVPSAGSRRRPASRARPHGTRASRALGETNSAARGDATQSISSCQAPGGDQTAPPGRGRSRVPCAGDANGARGDRTLEGVAPCLGHRGIRQRVGQLCPAPQAEFGSWSTDPGDRSRRLPDHAQAGVCGDADVGEPQNQGGRSESVTATSTRRPRRR